MSWILGFCLGVAVCLSAVWWIMAHLYSRTNHSEAARFREEQREFQEAMLEQYRRVADGIGRATARLDGVRCTYDTQGDDCPFNYKCAVGLPCEFKERG